MKNKIDYTLYLVTDRKLMSASTVEESVEIAILGGCTLVQLREKEISSLDFFSTAHRVKEITDKYHVPLIINDRIDIALAVNAAGVHIGQDDIPAVVVRKIIGPDKIIGVSASTLKEAIDAEKAGADYLGVGAMFSTDTKKDAKLISIEELCKIRQNISIPIVVIGGINKNTIPLLSKTGIDGIAVVSAIISQPNIEKAAQEIKELFISRK
ncbi:MAG: thiamine phosphate synthase [Spirochaetaceae bacterium]|nr:thiamine phosphate synthase [Spirochaetaceae bacterium]